MKRFLIIVILLALVQNTPIHASEGNLNSPSEVQKRYEIQAAQIDKRAKILADYLASYNSPLQYHAQDFIDAADTYDVDWKLVPAIAGVESTFGKRIPGGYNAWGWGVYGNQALGFKSWRDGIFTVTGGLRKNYIDKGYTEPYSMNKIYAASPTWGSKVTYFMRDIDKFAQEHYITKADTNNQKTNELVKVAATSGIVNTNSL